MKSEYRVTYSKSCFFGKHNVGTVIDQWHFKCHLPPFSQYIQKKTQPPHHVPLLWNKSMWMRENAKEKAAFDITWIPENFTDTVSKTPPHQCPSANIPHPTKMWGHASWKNTHKNTDGWVLTHRRRHKINKYTESDLHMVTLPRHYSSHCFHANSGLLLSAHKCLIRLIIIFYPAARTGLECKCKWQLVFPPCKVKCFNSALYVILTSCGPVFALS